MGESYTVGHGGMQIACDGSRSPRGERDQQGGVGGARGGDHGVLHHDRSPGDDDGVGQRHRRLGLGVDHAEDADGRAVYGGLEVQRLKGDVGDKRGSRPDSAKARQQQASKIHCFFS